jgi:hypothetical protein
MSVNAVQQYMLGLLDGLAVPGQGKPMDFYVTPPALQDMDGPHGYITGARVSAKRQTAPRQKYLGSTSTAGYKTYPWKVEIYLVYETAANNNPTADVEFPAILDAVIDVVELTQMPQWIDSNGVPVPTNTPIPGGSQIDAIGESWTLDFPPERTPATLRMLWYVALLTVDVLEVRQR